MDSLPFNVHKAFTENVAYLNISPLLYRIMIIECMLSISAV